MVDADDNGNGRRQRCLSTKERLEIARLDRLMTELQAEFERLYDDYKNLHSQHEKTFMDGKALEQKYLEMDSRTFRKQWRKLFEEEITLQELGTTIRQHAKKVLERSEEVWQARERLINNGGPN